MTDKTKDQSDSFQVTSKDRQTFGGSGASGTAAPAMVCAWCGKPAATTLVVEPAVYKTVQVTVEKYGRKFRQAQRRLITPERVAHACPEHAHPQLHDELAVKRQRRREAKEWAQHQDRLA